MDAEITISLDEKLFVAAEENAVTDGCSLDEWILASVRDAVVMHKGAGG